HPALSAPGRRHPHDVEGEVLGDLPLPDLLAPGYPRRLARTVDDRSDRSIRSGEDRPRRSPELSAGLDRAAAPMNAFDPADRRLARRLVLDELFDLSLYQTLRRLAPAHLQGILDRLIPIEEHHFHFWQDFFGLRVERLDLVRRLKLQLIVLVCRLFGAPAIHLVLEAIEVYGVS